MENTKIKFDISIFINSIHFIDIKDFLKYHTKYFIILHPQYDSGRFGDNRLNPSSPEFDENVYERNKLILNIYEQFIITNFNIISSKSNKVHKIFFCKFK